MNDQIKDFVEQHREEFDHLDAPAFDLDRFKRSRVEAVPEKVKKISFLSRSKWLVAASLVIVAATAWLFFYQQEQTVINGVPKNVSAGLQPKPVEKTNPVSVKEILPMEKSTVVTVANVAVKEPEKINKRLQFADNKHAYKALKDSSSASTRLLAILEIEKTNKVDKNTLDMLAQTLNHDGNTNVRLAALGVLQKYSGDKHASSLLISSLNRQDDPIVQLGLVSFLGKMKRPEIGEKLYILANNPETFAAVRDEAYTILLNQEKL